MLCTILHCYSKPLYGHVQEISPNNGPITVFLEALVGKHTVAVKNVKPLDYYSDSKLLNIVLFFKQNSP